jgi:dienelactone hydrolase
MQMKKKPEPGRTEAPCRKDTPDKPGKTRRTFARACALVAAAVLLSSAASAVELKPGDFHQVKPNIRSHGVDTRFKPVRFGRSLWLGQEIDLHGYLHIPAGEGKRKAVVYHGGCSGWYDVGPQYQADQIGWLVDQGYAVLHLDSFGSRGWRSALCPALAIDPLFVMSLQAGRDAYLALEYLRGLPEIDPDRIAFMGYSQGGNIGFYLGLDFMKPAAYPHRFKGVVALKPGCPHLYRGPVTTDMLAVYGGADTSVSGPANCRHYRAAQGVDYEMLVLEGVYNSWLTVGMPTQPFLTNLPDAPASFSRFDPRAREITKEKTLTWLSEKLR